jgi:hypothetical protein
MKTYDNLKEGNFPPYYRQEEMKTLQEAIKHRRSLFIAGLSGMGKSNLIRFFVSHPPQDADVINIYVDCNSISAGSEEELYAAILDQLSLIIDVDEADIIPDGWALRRILKRYVRQLARAGKHLVIVLDRFEQFTSQKANLYNYLRSLRDSAGGGISYLLAARKYPPRASLKELGELLTSEPLWVDPLNFQDARDSIERDGRRLGYKFDKEQKHKLYDLTGGHPGLLKNACEMVAKGTIDLSQEQLADKFLQNRSISEECRELWLGLSDTERSELGQSFSSLSKMNEIVAQSLLIKGIVVEKSEKHSVSRRFFSPIFRQAIQALIAPPLPDTEVRISIQGNKVFIGHHECPLSEKEFALFQILLKRRGEVVAYDQIVSHVWPGCKGDVSDEMIHSLKFSTERRLKTVYDVNYIQTHRGRGYELLERITKPT